MAAAADVPRLRSAVMSSRRKAAWLAGGVIKCSYSIRRRRRKQQINNDVNKLKHGSAAYVVASIRMTALGVTVGGFGWRGVSAYVHLQPAYERKAMLLSGARRHENIRIKRSWAKPVGALRK